MNFKIVQALFNSRTDSEVRIPTLLGVGLLLTGLIAGVVLTAHSQNLQIQAGKSLLPKNIAVANLTANSASVYWQTDEEAPGFIKAGTTSLDLTFRDERDPKLPQPHQLHFVTLTNLNPDTAYNYKIVSGSSVFPQEEMLSFKTPKPGGPSDLQPLVGSILNSSLQPVREALITLEIPGAQVLASITKYSGNFILPLAGIRTQDLTDKFDISEIKNAVLVASNFEKSSQITIPLPFADVTLPPVILGQDLNLMPSRSLSPAQDNPFSIYDLNSDGVVNSLDISTLKKNLDQPGADKKFDINSDGTVDQQDIESLNQYFSQTRLR